MPQRLRRPLCRASNPNFSSTPGPTGHNDSADPNNHVLLRLGRGNGVLRMSEEGYIVLAKAGPGLPVLSGRAIPLEELLQNSAEKLKKIAFGNPLRQGGKYDSNYWQGIKWGVKGTQMVDYVLALRPKQRPSDAIQAIVNARNKWTFDCAFFVQAVLLHVLLQRLGAAKFDAYLKEDAVRTRGLVLFRSHRSTGLIVKRQNQFPAVTPARPSSSSISSANRALNSAPLGTEIVFTNPNAPESSGFRNENTIKIEPDLFIAHGVHSESAFANRAAIERKLKAVARTHNPSLRNEEQFVSVTWVTRYKLIK